MFNFSLAGGHVDQIPKISGVKQNFHWSSFCGNAPTTLSPTTVELQSKFCILDPLKRPVNQFTRPFVAKKVDSYFRYKKQPVLFVYILF